MAQGPAANALAGLLGSAARYATLLGVGASLLQTSMYTGERVAGCAAALSET